MIIRRGLEKIKIIKPLVKTTTNYRGGRGL
jgi:hypothetical protein